MTPFWDFFYGLCALGLLSLCGVAIADQLRCRAQDQSRHRSRVRIPAPLETWGFLYHDKPDGSPWFTPRAPEPIIVTIYDVRDGWVRFHYGKALGEEGGFNDHREQLDTFMRRFKPWPPT